MGPPFDNKRRACQGGSIKCFTHTFESPSQMSTEKATIGLDNMEVKRNSGYTVGVKTDWNGVREEWEVRRGKT